MFGPYPSYLAAYYQNYHMMPESVRNQDILLTPPSADEEDKRKKRPTLNDADLRDHTMSLIRGSNINYTTYFLKATPSELEEKPELESWDGLMRRPEGYFRVARDSKTDNKLILFEFEPDALKGQRKSLPEAMRDSETPDDATYISFANVDSEKGLRSLDVYLVGAFHPDADQVTLNEAINAFCRNLRNDVVPGLDLYLRDETEYYDGDEPADEHVFRAANSMVAFAMYQEPGSGWQSALYSSLRGEHDTSGQFERVSLKKTSRRERFTSAFLMNKDEIKNADSFGQVFKYTMQFWGLSSLKKFKGEKILSDNMTLRSVMAKKTNRERINLSKAYARQQWRRGLKATSGFLGKRWKEYGISGLVSAALSVKFFKLQAVRATLVAVGSVFASTMVGKFIDERTQGGVAHAFRNRAEYKAMKGMLPQNRDYSRFYTRNRPGNEGRLLKKVDPAFLETLELLNHAQSGVMDSMDKTSAVNSRAWKEQYLGGLETRIFGKANIALCDDTVLKIMPNGVLSLTKVNKEFNSISKYYGYRPEFVSSRRAPLHPRVKDMIAKGIFHVEDQRGEIGLKSRVMRRCDFTKSLKKIYAETANIKGEETQIPALLAALFNPNAKGDAHDLVADLLRESAKISFEEPQDPLDQLVEITRPETKASRVLSFLKKPKDAPADEDRSLTANVTPMAVPQPKK